MPPGWEEGYDENYQAPFWANSTTGETSWTKPTMPAGADPSGLNGRRIMLQGLVSRADLNGQCGLVLSFDADEGRYAVQMESDGETVALKPSNLSPA